MRRRAALALAAISSIASAFAFAPRNAPARAARGARADAPAARRRTRRASTETTAAPATDTSSYVITITPEAQDHIAKLRAAEGPGTHLRMGVKAGGCSGNLPRLYYYYDDLRTSPARRTIDRDGRGGGAAVKHERGDHARGAPSPCPGFPVSSPAES